MLDNYFSFDPPSEAIEKRDPYKLAIRQCDHWKNSKHRILIVMETVDGRDIREGEMMGCRETENAVKNAIKYARKIATPYLKGNQLPSAAYTVANFNAFKSFHLPPGPRREADMVFADRIHKLIRKIKPTHILMSGDQAMHSTFPQIIHPQYKRGWVHDLSLGDLKFKVVNTLDFFQLLAKDGEYANLLGFWCRHFGNLMLGKLPHDLSHVKATPRYVDTIEKFDRVMKRFDEAEWCGVDTETRNLSVLFNKIYTIQLCMNSAPDVGYIISVDHPMAHWTKEERIYIKKELRRRFARTKGPNLVTFNGMYDLRVIRQQLKIPIIWLKVWEITFGEHLLDENVSALNKVTHMRDTAADDASRFGGLRPIYCSYGNDHYFNAKFSKNERANVGSTDPTDKEFQLYAATDVVSIMAMRLEQIRRSSFMEIAGKNYKPFYVRHMMFQMSDTAHQLSHLRNDGSKIQKTYLKHLLSSDSPLRKELKRSAGEFRVFKEVKQANDELLKESGFKVKAGGLFGAAAKAVNWMFKLSRTPHKKKLFFDIMGLEPLSQTKTGQPAIDKAFIAHYKDRNKIIGLYGEYQALSKLLSTYVKGWFKKFRVNHDVAKDHHLRPDYSVWAVVTGRLASFGPNLQQIPSRGKLAKIIKRMFVASKGYLMIRYDYSAHEVRVWSIASGDEVLAEAFKAGQKLRQKFIQTMPVPEEDVRLKAYIEEWLNYDKETGKFTWKKSPSRPHPIGSAAGTKQPDAYYIRIEQKTYAAHRLAFLLSWGWLPEEVDHKDNNPHNNVLTNLRPATRVENSRNRRTDSTKTSSEYKGVFKGTRAGSWVAQIKPAPDQKTKHLGVFDTQAEAHAAYVKAAKKYHKNFANDGEESLADEDDGDYRHPFVKAKEAIKMKGDIHILNVLRFFGKLVDKDHPLRDAVKAVVFGVLYGKGAETLGIDTKKADMDSLKGKISALYDESLVSKDVKRLAEINRMLEELDIKLTALIAEDRTDYAQSIIDKMMKEFKAGARWTEKMQRLAEEEYYVYSPIGRRRFLPAALTGDRKIVAQQVRRGSNAPIQGYASEIGVRAGREIMKAYYSNLKRLKTMLGIDKTDWEMRVLFNRTVHDANYYSVPYAMVLPFIHMLQYQATYGVTAAYERDFNVKFTVEPEIEIELGAQDAASYKWDWSLPNLVANLKQTLKDSAELGVLEGTPEEVLEEIMRPWENKDVRAFLQENFPLLGVKKLNRQMDDALTKANFEEPEKIAA